MHSTSSSLIIPTRTRSNLKPANPSLIFRSGWRITSHTVITMVIVNKVSPYQEYPFLIYLHRLLLALLTRFSYLIPSLVLIFRLFGCTGLGTLIAFNIYPSRPISFIFSFDLPSCFLLLPARGTSLTVANTHPALWPLFHYLLWQDVATEHASADANYEYYEQVRSVGSSNLLITFNTPPKGQPSIRKPPR